MFKIFLKTAVFMFVFFLSTTVLEASSDSPTVFYRNDNIILTPHPKPEDFTVMENEEVEGHTPIEISFNQTNVINDTTRLQRFQIQEAWWYISDRGVIGYGEGLSDLQALSIYMTMKDHV